MKNYRPHYRDQLNNINLLPGCKRMWCIFRTLVIQVHFRAAVLDVVTVEGYMLGRLRYVDFRFVISNRNKRQVPVEDRGLGAIAKATYTISPMAAKLTTSYNVKYLP